MSLESEARQEFARILTKVTRIMNGVLDGRPWGGVGPEAIATGYNSSRFVVLESATQEHHLTMHASYDPAAIEAFYRARQQMGYPIVTKDLPQDNVPGYVIIAEPV